MQSLQSAVPRARCTSHLRAPEVLGPVCLPYCHHWAFWGRVSLPFLSLLCTTTLRRGASHSQVEWAGGQLGLGLSLADWEQPGSFCP